jgi:hypothetical protein
MTLERDWIIQQQHKKTEFQRKQSEVRERENDALNKSMSFHKPIPNMRDAYAEVRAKNHELPQEYIEYSRFTSGAFIDNEKGK